MTKMISALVAALVLAVGAMAAKLPVEAFGHLPAIVDADISPSGGKVALIVNEGVNQRVMVLDTKTRSVIGGAAAPQAKANDARGRYSLAGVTWFSDERFFVIARSLGVTRGGDAVQDCGLLSVSADGRESVLMMNFIVDGDIRFKSCGILSLKGPEPDTILMTAYTEGGQRAGARARSSIDVYAVNVKTGKGRIYEAGNLNTGGFRVDREGTVRLRFDGDSSSTTVHARLHGSQEWTPVYSGRVRNYTQSDNQERAQGRRSQFVGFGGFGTDLDKVYVFLSGKGTNHIAQFNLKTRQLEAPVLQDPRFDVGGLVSLRNGKVIGARIPREYPETVYFLDDWKQLQRVINESFPGDRVSVVSSNDDLTKHILYLEGPQSPSGEYLFLDLTAGDAKSIGFPYPLVKGPNVVAAKWVTYPARDGTPIPAYVTMPASAPAGKALPAIVLPHGGPRARDFGDFEWMSQALANAGYVVLQPQFRGSAGFGFEWDEAGAKQWGRLMQDDVSDGVKYLVSQGIADAKRICIAGWSYGGYAAGAGATLTPELYRCVIAGAGVFDLVEMLRYVDAPGVRDVDTSVLYWKYYIGDPDKDRASVEAVSPIKHVANVQAPILLIHGRVDTTVPFKQSELFRDALIAAGKQVEFVELKAEDHYMTFAPTRIQTMQAMRDFLLKHNPPN
jgi:dipeptidyl aminopeptidase/acylaminoacyl peptidase